MSPATGETTDTAVDVENLLFRYPGNEYELAIPRLRIATHRKAAIIGPSGSGKTTLLHLLAGILAPDAGRITVAGTVLGDVPDSRRRRLRMERIGLVFQEFELLEHLSVRENILLPFMLAPSLGKVDEAHFSMLTKRTGIDRYLNRRPRRLSQGERQRVAICRALVTQPALILADEPTGNLDPKTTAEILDTMIGEVERHDATLVMVTHDHSLIERFDEVIDFAEFRVSSHAPESETP